MNARTARAPLIILHHLKGCDDMAGIIALLPVATLFGYRGGTCRRLAYGKGVRLR